MGVAPSIEHRDSLGHLSPDVVLDVGANKGQFALFSRVTFPDAVIHSFEPIEAAYRTLISHRCLRNNFNAYHLALTDKTGDATINLSRADDSSSLLPIGNLQTSYYPGTEMVGQEVIKTDTLDNQFQEEWQGRNVLLKIDVQGTELQVLKGASNNLDRIGHIYAELSFMELYKGQALGTEIIEFLSGFGFEVYSISNISRTRHDRLVQADFLFTR